MLAPQESVAFTAAALSVCAVLACAPLCPAGAVEALKLQGAPELVSDGGCKAADKTSFSATYERRGIFDDTTWAQDRYTEYLVDGSGKILDARSRTAAVATWQRVTAVLETAVDPSPGEFEIVLYEEADSVPPFSRGERAKFNAALVRQRLQFNASLLDPDCPGPSSQ